MIIDLGTGPGSSLVALAFDLIGGIGADHKRREEKRLRGDFK